MVINVHAGHNPHGKVACGAVGLISESLENLPHDRTEEWALRWLMTL